MDCGRPLTASSEVDRETLRTVTVVFTDVVESVALAARFEPEVWRSIMARYFDLAREVLERHGGTVQKFAGDAVMAVFGVEELHEDDALRAVTAAFKLHTTLSELNDELEREWNVRLDSHTGVNTGEVSIGYPIDGHMLVLGTAINLAARLQSAAGRDEILIGHLTYTLVRDSVTVERVRPLALRGIEKTVNAWRLDGVYQGPRPTVRSDAPLVDRELELALLNLELERVMAERRCHMVTVRGDSGVGKSRLVDEFARGVRQRATVLHGSCYPHGDAIMDWPMMQILQQAAGILRDDAAERVREKVAKLARGDESITAQATRLLGLSDVTGESEDTYRAMRRILELMAEEQPLVVVVDDLHFAKPALLEFIEHVAESPRSARILLVCLARPQFFEDQPDWGGSIANSASVQLSPLNEAQTGQLIGHLLKEGAPLPEVEDHIKRAAMGVPLYVEELIRMLTDEKTIYLQNGQWVLAASSAEVRTPPNIRAVLAARLDRLELPEREVVERAAVVGMQFKLAEVVALMPEGDRDVPTVTAILMGLIRKELLQLDPAGASPDGGDEDGFRFRHVLIQDTAYRRIGKEARAALHERFASWLEDAADGSAYADQVLGFHLERAYRNRVELGRGNGSLRELARRAGERLAAAGHRGVAHGESPSSAANHLRRAIELLPEDHPERLNAFLDLADALRESRLEEASQTYAEVIAAAKAVGNEGAAMHAALGRLEVTWFHDFQGDWDEGLEQIQEAIRVFEELGDDLGGAKARRLLAYAHGGMGLSTAARAEAQHAITLVRRTGDERLEAKIRRLYGVVLFWGPTPLDEVVRENEEAVRWARQKGLYSLEAGALSLLARAAAMRGDFSEARRLNRRAEQLIPDLGELLTVAADSISEGLVELLAGDLEAAERALRRGYEALERRGITGIRSTIAAMLARVLLRLGRDDEAEAFIEVCRRDAAEHQLDNQIKWRELRALVLANRGEHAEAERLAREAVDRAERSEQVNSQADAYFDLGVVLRVAGRPDEAVPAATRARELYQHKGNLVSARRVQDWLEAAETS